MLALTIADRPLLLRVRCYGGRGAARERDDGTWTIDLDDDLGVGIFLLGDDAEDGDFLERLDPGPRWERVFHDPDWHQLALHDDEHAVQVLLKLEFPGAPIPSATPNDDGVCPLEEAAGPALWVTVTRTSIAEP
jgi:hypothetical protein